MTGARKHYTADQKIAILRRHLLEQVRCLRCVQ